MALGWKQVTVIVLTSLCALSVVCFVVYFYGWVHPNRKKQWKSNGNRGLYDAVRAATTKQLNLTTPLEESIDGVVLQEHDRVLVKTQAKNQENGIYALKKNYLTRTSDLNADAKIVVGSRVFVEEGSVHGQTIFVLQMVTSNGQRFQGISHGLLFVHIFEELFGRNRPSETGHVLVLDPSQPTGVHWESPKNLWNGQENIVTVTIPPETTTTFPVALPSSPHELSYHNLHVFSKEWTESFGITVHPNNGIVVELQHSFSKGSTKDSEDNVIILNEHETEDWFVPQPSRVCKLQYTNPTTTPETLKIKIG